MGGSLAVISVATHMIGTQAVDAEENDVGFFRGHGILCGIGWKNDVYEVQCFDLRVKFAAGSGCP